MGLIRMKFGMICGWPTLVFVQCGYREYRFINELYEANIITDRLLWAVLQQVSTAVWLLYNMHV